MTRTIQDSEKLYETAKQFFNHLVGEYAVIEISNSPLEDWKILLLRTDEEFIEEKIRFAKVEAPCISFAVADGESVFQYSDENILKGENCKTGEIEYFYDHAAEGYLLEQARREIVELIRTVVS